MELTQDQIEKAKQQAENTGKMLQVWAERQGNKLLKEMKRAGLPETLSLHWGKVKQGWLGGFASGVQAGFQLGYETANRMKGEIDTFVEESGATLGVTPDETKAVEAEGQERLPNL